MNRESVAGTISGQGSVGAEVRKEPICFSQSCMYSLPGKRPSGLMSGGGLLPLRGMPKKRGMPFRGGWFSIRFWGMPKFGEWLSSDWVCRGGWSLGCVVRGAAFEWPSRQKSGIQAGWIPPRVPRMD